MRRTGQPTWKTEGKNGGKKGARRALSPVSSRDFFARCSVFQITFQHGLSPTNIKASLDVDISKLPQVYHLFCWVSWPTVSGF